MLRGIDTEAAAFIINCTKEASVTNASKVDVLLVLVKISVTVELMKIIGKGFTNLDILFDHYYSAHGTQDCQCTSEGE